MGQRALDGYEVEFIPLERRLNDRRTHANTTTMKDKRQKCTGRRENEADHIPQWQCHVFI